MCILAGDSTDREAVSAVRRHVDFGGLVIEPQEYDGVASDFGINSNGGQHKNSIVILANTEFTHRGDHAIGNVSVGFPRGDLEVTGQHRPGKCHHNLVADDEIIGATNYAVHRVAAVRRRRSFRSHLYLTPVDGLTVGLRLRLLGEDLAHNDRTVEFV